MCDRGFDARMLATTNAVLSVISPTTALTERIELSTAIAEFSPTAASHVKASLSLNDKESTIRAGFPALCRSQGPCLLCRDVCRTVCPWMKPVSAMPTGGRRATRTLNEIWSLGLRRGDEYTARAVGTIYWIGRCMFQDEVLIPAVKVVW